MVSDILGMLFGPARNAVTETIGAFRPNAEAADQRQADLQAAALAQLSAEFRHQDRGLFDRLIDGVNRLPRPAMALGTLGLFVAAMVDPLWFSERMQGIALVPEPLWWLLGAVVSFYFGARHQAKGQEFQRAITRSLARVPLVVDNLQSLRRLRADSPGVADTGPDATLTLDAVRPGDNPALAEWRQSEEARKGR